MDFGLVLCQTGLSLVTSWIPGEGLGSTVMRPKVKLDAVHNLHYNHREIFNVYVVESTQCLESSSWNLLESSSWDLHTVESSSLVWKKIARLVHFGCEFYTLWTSHV